MLKSNWGFLFSLAHIIGRVLQRSKGEACLELFVCTFIQRQLIACTRLNVKRKPSSGMEKQVERKLQGGIMSD
jgi:hypothetical protein